MVESLWLGLVRRRKEEEEEGGMKEGKTALIKSNKPHLAGGEKPMLE